jgi:hypothetical protein
MWRPAAAVQVIVPSGFSATPVCAMVAQLDAKASTSQRKLPSPLSRRLENGSGFAHGEGPK